MSTFRIRLHGGPVEIPAHELTRVVAGEDLEEHVRISFRAGYEHFFYDKHFPISGDSQRQVRHYVWRYRTYVAE